MLASAYHPYRGRCWGWCRSDGKPSLIGRILYHHHQHHHHMAYLRSLFCELPSAGEPHHLLALDPAVSERRYRLSEGHLGWLLDSLFTFAFTSKMTRALLMILAYVRCVG